MDASNYELVVERLTQLIATTARMEPQDIDPYENLIELGADSIILTDVNSYIREEFGVEIPLTLFFERLTSVAEIAEYLVPQLAPEYFTKGSAQVQEPALASTLEASAPTPVQEAHPVRQEPQMAQMPQLPQLEALPVTEGPASDITQLFAQQLQIMNNQIRMLSGGQLAAAPAASQTVAELATAAAATAATAEATREAAAPEIASREQQAAAAPKAEAAAQNDSTAPGHQPYIAHKRIETTKKQGNEKQQQHIQELMERYTAKTPGSKAFAAKYRLPYADWRNISGFRPAIKEMVYQLVFQNSQGAHITDIDGNDYIDLTMDFGVSLFGHNAEFIKEAISEEMTKGFPLSLITELSGEVAQYISEFTGVERVSFFNSGTEAVMVAMRLARAATGKDKIVIFSGAYHGTFDGVLGMHPMGREKDAVSPIAGGIMQNYVDDLFILDYDDPASLTFISEHADEIAAVMVEPVQSRRPDLQPREFLHQLRDLTANSGIKLIFDEMILGFRLGKGGAQEYFGIQADLVTYGKIVGGGMPIGIVAGKQEVMDCIDGGVWQYGDDSVPPYEDKRTFAGGTFCHHPLAMAAARAVLLKIREEADTIYPLINQRTKRLADELNAFFQEENVPAEIVYCGSLFRFVLKGNMEMFYYHLLDKGIYIWEGRNCFLSASHTDEDMDRIIKGVKDSCLAMKHVFFAKNEEPAVLAKKKEIELTLEQQKMIASEMMNQGTSAFHQCILLQIEGELNTGDLNKAAELMASRHEILRYTFSSDMSKLVPNPSLETGVSVIPVQESSEAEVLSGLTKYSFDYVNGLLYRIFLLRNEQDTRKSKLLVVAHHFIADGWSLSLFCEELIEAYNSFRTGTSPSLGEVVSYREFLHNHEALVGKLDKQEVLQFWEDYLAGCDHELALPTKDVMAEAHAGRGERITHTTDEQWLKKVRKAAAASRCSPFMVLLSAYQAMLHEITQQQQFAVGVPFAGQATVAPKALIGNCVSILPVVAHVNERATLATLAAYNRERFKQLDGIHNVALDAVDHEGSIVHPRMNVMFNMDRMPQTKSFVGTTMSLQPVEVESSMYDLFFNIIELDGKAVFDIDYNSDMLARPTVVRWLDLYLDIVSQWCAQPEQQLDELQMFVSSDVFAAEQAMTHVELNELEAKLGLKRADYGITDDRVYGLILNKQGRPVPTDQYGYLYIGRNRMENFHTGWAARVTHDARLELLGPEEHCFVRDGKWYSLWLIAGVVQESPAVQDARVSLDEASGDLSAYVVPAAEGLTANDLVEWCLPRMPLHMLPKQFYAVADLASEQAQELTYQADEMTATEKTVFGMISTLLGFDAFGKQDNIISLGMNSLKLLQLLSNVQAEYNGIRVPITEVADALTVSGIAAIVDGLLQEGQTQLASIPKMPDHQAFYETSAAQKRMYALNQMQPDTLGYNMPSIVKVEGKFDPDRFQAAVSGVVQRHENLRTRFLEADGDIVQIVTDLTDVQVELSDRTGELNEEELVAMLKAEYIKPFRLNEAPLLRVSVIQYEAQRYMVFMDFHHIVFDGASSLVFAREVMALYDGMELPQLPVQYKDFVMWHKERLASEEMQQQELFWKQQLEASPPGSSVPLDHVRPEHRTCAGKLRRQVVSPELKHAILELCKEQGTTSYSFFLSALQAMLSMYTMQKDLIVGTLVEGRHHYELEPLIGMFVNTLPIRTTVDQQQSFADFMQTVQRQAMQAFANSEVPFDRIVDLSGAKHEKGRNPLFDLLFSYQDFGAFKLPGEDTTFQYEELWTEDCKFDIEFEVVDSGEQFELIVQYASELYEESTIDRMIQHYMTLISSIVTDGSRKLAELDMVTAEEKQQILTQFNSPHTVYEEGQTIVDVFERWAATKPDQTALLFERERISYLALNSRANQMARLLLSKGLQQEDVVGIMMHRSPNMLRSIMGIWKAGGAYLPLDVDHPLERRLNVLEEAGVKVVLTDSAHVEPDFRARFEGTILCLDELESQWSNWQEDNVGTAIDAYQLAYILFTSGSTGKPKGVMIEHAGMLNHIWAERDLLGLDDSLVFAQNANHCFDISVWQMVGALVLGGTTAIYSNELVRQPQRFIDQVVQDGVTLLEVVPSYMTVMLEDAEDGRTEYRSLKHLIITGEMVKPHLLEKWFAVYPDIAIVNAYGPAEASDDVTQYVADSMPEKLTNVPIGKPLANVRIYILDAEGRLCPVGVAGELCVAGISVGRGYVNQLEKTRQSFLLDPYAEPSSIKGHNRMYRTGDLARWKPDGNIEYLGRMDEQVKIRGHRIELGEIESVLRAQPGVRDAAVIAREDEAGDPYICAYVVPAAEGTTFDVDQSRIQLRRELPDYMMPSYFVTLEQLPVTSNGKLDRRALPEPERQGGGKTVGPRNDTEAYIIVAFSEVLGLDRDAISVHDSFFDLGGHSLRAIRAINLIESYTGVRLPLRTVFEHPTAEALSRMIVSEPEQAYEPIPQAPIRDRYPMSSAQKRLFVIHEMDKTSTVYNMPGMIEMHGEVDLPRITQAFQQLVNRHESLRTSFHMHEGEPVQRIHAAVTVTVDYEKTVVQEADGQVPNKQTADELLADFVQPFNVQEAPLMRIKVVKTGESRSLVLFDMHHLVSDGMTINLITKEFSQLYNGEELEQPVIQYKDYSEWLRTQDLSEEKNYWLSQFEGELPVLDLPLDYPRPQLQSFAGAAVTWQLDAALREQVQELCRVTGATEYMVLLSGLMVLLGKYSRQEDIIVGSPVSGRLHHDTEQMVGMFVNTLAMRGKPEADKAYTDFLNEIKETSLKAYEYQAYPFEDIIEQLQVRRDLSRNPLFDVMLVLQNQEEEALSAQGLAFGDIEADLRTAKFDLTINVTASPSGYELQWEYGRDLFKEATVERMAAHFEQLLQAVTEAPEQKLGELEVVTAAEKQLLLHDFHEAPASYPEQATIKELFEAQVRRTPQQIAATCEGEQWTYAELNRKANYIARQLLELKGEGETVVGLLLERNLHLLAGILGVVKAGCAYLPMDPDAPEDRIAYMLQDSGARVLLAGGDTGENALPNLAFDGTKLTIEALLEQLETADSASYAVNPEVPMQPQDALYMIYTSGTTGQPKGTMIEHRNVVRLMVNDRMPFDFSADDVWSLFHSYNFDFSVWEMYGALLYGGKVVVIPKAATRDSYAFLGILRKERVTVLNQVPSSFYELMHAELAGEGEPLHVRYLIFGGEALHVSKLKAWHEKYPEMAIVNMYGITETTVHVTHKRIGAEDIQRGISNIGQAIPTLKLYILNGDQLCGIGMPGELCIAGAGVARGYVNRAELTQAKFVDNPYVPGERMYRSGDLARWLPDGNVEYIGRIDDQVKIRGYRIELKEIEKVLMKQPGVQDAAVIVRKDGAGDSYLSAYVVGKENEADLDLESLKAGIGEDLPDYMVPGSIMVLAKLPITSNGKLDRRALPEPVYTSGEAYVAPRDEREQLLADVFAQVLGMEQVGIDDNFFELGGDSIKAIRVISKLREAGYELTVKDLMLERTIRWIAVKVEEAVEGVTKYPQEEVTGEVLLTPIQQEFYDWQLAKPEHYNQTMLLTSTAALSSEHLRQALAEVVKHHDMLRAVYTAERGQVLLSSEESKGFEFVECHLENLEREQDVRQAVEEEANRLQESISLSDGPLLKVGLFKIMNGDLLLLCLHHLVVDGVSWRIILEDLETAYEQAMRKEEIVLPAKTASYQQWAQALQEYARSEELERELRYWQDVSTTAQAAAEQQSSDTASAASYHTVDMELDSATTNKLLFEANTAYHTEINDLLLTALVRTLEPWTSAQGVTIDLEGHGRESIHRPLDIDRTVGWFTSIFPVHLPVVADMEQHICTIKEQLRKVPNRGMGYGVIKHFREDALPELHPTYCFNYLGQLDNESGSRLLGLSDWSAGESMAKDNQHPNALTINASIVQEKLVLEITYDMSRYTAEQISDFSKRFRAVAASIADHCTSKETSSLTASDFGDLELELDEFDEIMKNYS